MLILCFLSAPSSLLGIDGAAWGGLAYVSLFSILISFILLVSAVLALGGIAGVGQLQLLQPFFGLVLAATLLREQVGWQMVACAPSRSSSASRAPNGLPAEGSINATEDRACCRATLTGRDWSEKYFSSLFGSPSNLAASASASA